MNFLIFVEDSKQWLKAQSLLCGYKDFEKASWDIVHLASPCDDLREAAEDTDEAAMRTEQRNHCVSRTHEVSLKIKVLIFNDVF